MWEILNANNVRWGSELYPSREAADAELRSFFKGVSGVRLDRFTIRHVGDHERSSRHYDSQGYCDNPGRGY